MSKFFKGVQASNHESCDIGNNITARRWTVA